MRPASIRVSSPLLLSALLLLTLCSCEPTPTTEPERAEPQAELGAVRVRNFSLSKSFHRVVSEASRAIDAAASQVGGAITKAYAEANKEATLAVGRTALSSVVAEAFRNAAGQVVDGVNTVISYVPTSWPDELGPDAANSVVKAATSQINSALDDLQRQARVLKGLSAADAESRINGWLAPRKVQMPKISIPGVGQLYVPLSAPLYVKIRQSQWESSNSANLQIKLDFFGLKTYRIGFGCIGFPDGFSQPPRVAFNGGCDNPWKLLSNANLVAGSAKKVSAQIGRAIEGIGPQIMAEVRKLAGAADNPRSVPPLALDLPINELLGLCCSLAFPSTKSGETQMAESTVASDSLGNIGKDAALSFTVPELQGVSFELSPDLSPVIFIGDTWTTRGEMEVAVQLGFFGLFVANVKMGCITFGESWSTTPHFTFEGGCDKSWRVDFAAPGYTSAPHRMDARLASGAMTEVVPPPLPRPPTVVAPGQIAAGGSTSVYATFYGYGPKYQLHTFTLDGSSDFVVTEAMEGVPIEYLIVAGGGSGASNKTNGKIGVGGGGGGGVLTNVDKNQPLYLSAGTYTVVVGAGGTAPYREGNGLNGGNSSISGTGLIAIGGGGGGRIDDKANDGGSGGGGGYRKGAPLIGAASSGQGFPGGKGRRSGKDDEFSAGGGGGGAGSVGRDSLYDRIGGSGGNGIRSTITGNYLNVGGGGGGGGAVVGGSASSGGGAGGYYTAEPGKDGAPNTGGGGGGAASRENKSYKGGDGGSGIVIIRYPISG